ncbi:MAG: hypothetical protein DVB29_01015 [Verrucomicrobia bacterium]|nr:MAG: hypothetical protein DVB29_01015 [Verrucomicrobiota bacterium]
MKAFYQAITHDIVMSSRNAIFNIPLVGAKKLMMFDLANATDGFFFISQHPVISGSYRHDSIPFKSVFRH